MQQDQSQYLALCITREILKIDQGKIFKSGYTPAENIRDFIHSLSVEFQSNLVDMDIGIISSVFNNARCD